MKNRILLVITILFFFTLLIVLLYLKSEERKNTIEFGNVIEYKSLSIEEGGIPELVPHIWFTYLGTNSVDSITFEDETLIKVGNYYIKWRMCYPKKEDCKK